MHPSNAGTSLRVDAILGGLCDDGATTVICMQTYISILN